MNLSVVIPALNEERYIEKTLQSLRNQTTRVEIVVVDNGSCDKTVEIAQKMADKVFVYDEKKGPLFAANYGIERARGEIIAMAGADCIYPPKWAKRVIEAFERDEKVVGVYGPVRFFDSNVIMNFLSGFFYEIFVLSTRLLGVDNTSGANFSFKKDVYLKINDFVHSWNTIAEDIEIGRRIKKYGKIVLLPFNFSYTSARRFQKNGYVRSALTFVREWRRFKKEGKNISIEDYWKR